MWAVVRVLSSCTADHKKAVLWKSFVEDLIWEKKWITSQGANMWGRQRLDSPPSLHKEVDFALSESLLLFLKRAPRHEARFPFMSCHKLENCFHQREYGSTRSSSSQGRQLIYSERLFTDRPRRYMAELWIYTRQISSNCQPRCPEGRRAVSPALSWFTLHKKTRTERDGKDGAPFALNQTKPPGSFIRRSAA